MSQAPSEQAMSQETRSQKRWKGAQRACNEPGSQQETMHIAGESARSQGANNEPGNQQGASNGPEIQQGAREAAMRQRSSNDLGTL